MNTITPPLRVLVVDDSEDTAESLRITAGPRRGHLPGEGLLQGGTMNFQGATR